MKLCTLTVLLLASTVSAYAGSSGLFSTHELREDCRPYVNDHTTNEKTAACAGYISAVLDMIAEAPSSELEDGLIVAQVAEMFIEYVNQHPQDLNVNASLELTKVLIENKKLTVKN